MAKFTYNNAKNASTGYMPFELNYGYYPQILYKEEFNLRSQFKSADKLALELKQLIIIYHKNLYHTQEL